MAQQPTTQAEIVEEAYTILLQLGGPRFLTFTGAHEPIAAGRSAHNPNPWLRMTLQRNQAGVNRMKVTLMVSGTYTVEFYRQEVVEHVPVISHEQVLKLVYAEDLPRLFTSVTGYVTHF